MRLLLKLNGEIPVSSLCQYIMIQYSLNRIVNMIICSEYQAHIFQYFALNSDRFHFNDNRYALKC